MEIAGRLLFLFLFSQFAYKFWNDFLLHHRLSDLLILIKESLVVIFVAFRHFPKTVSLQPHEWVITLLATCTTPVFLPHGTEDNLFGLSIQFLGLLVTLGGVISINRSFGLVPANRGVKTGGLYRLVRHPIYMGYLLSNTGFFISHAALPNMAVFAAFVIFMSARILLEEKHLLADAEYQAYVKRVRWRLVPYIW